MSPSDLKNYISCGRQVQFEYFSRSYVVGMVYMYPSSEYAFGPQYGSKITSSSFDDLLYRHDYGFSLSEMLRSLDRSRFQIY